MTDTKPCAGLVYDVETGVLEGGLFALREHRDRGRTLKVVLDWTPTEGGRHSSPATLRRDFYGMIGTLSGPTTSIYERQERDVVVFHVITGGATHTDILEFSVGGAAITEMLERVRKEAEGMAVAQEDGG
jgi:hypothetical protein